MVINKIGTCTAARGMIRYGFLEIERGYRVPVAIMKGKKEGKNCFITGGIHGDELNGIKLVHMLMAKLDPKTITGTIVFLPILNLSGFRKQIREVAEDGRDLNRCFGKRGGTLSYKIAKKIMKEVVNKCDFGIDCHDYGEREVLLPHARVQDALSGVEGSVLELGRLLGTEIILVRDGEKGMLAVEAYRKLGRPVVTVEVGGGLVLWDEFLERTYRGILNILAHHGFIKRKITLPREQYLIKDLDRFSYITKSDGLLYKNVKIGDIVHKGDVIGVIYDPVTRKKKRVISRHCGFVFSLKFRDRVGKGDGIASILQSQDCPVHGTKRQKHFDVIRNYTSILDFTKRKASGAKNDAD